MRDMIKVLDKLWTVPVIWGSLGVTVVGTIVPSGSGQIYRKFAIRFCESRLPGWLKEEPHLPRIDIRGLAAVSSATASSTV